MASWFKLTVDVPANLSEVITGFLFDLGSGGLQVEDGPNPSLSRLIAYFPSTEIPGDVEASLRQRLQLLPGAGSGSRIVGQDVPDEDWSAAWREHFEPVRVTRRITVCPPWRPVEPADDGFVILIEPKTAFGTGRHPTTKLALQALEAAVRDGNRVLDVGTGSGILSIAARRLGARCVTALDVDPEAGRNVRENLALNGVDGVTFEVRTVADGDRGYDVAVANITRGVLLPMLPRLRKAVRPGGRLILGGLLDREEEVVRESLTGAGLGEHRVCREAEWVGITAVKVLNLPA